METAFCCLATRPPVDCGDDQFSTSYACGMARRNGNDDFCYDDDDCVSCSRCSESNQHDGMCTHCIGKYILSSVSVSILHLLHFDITCMY